MGGEWKECSWGDLATIEYGKALAGYQESDGAYQVYGTNGPIGWCSKPLYDNPSVIIGRKGAYRGIHFSPKPFHVIDTAFYLKPSTDFDIRWAYYELLTHDINGMDSGSAIPSTSREDFYALPVLSPPLPEQKAIAHILGSLDDKIELNRKMNETLVAMAKAIFKSWFVDFDPVKAKAVGRKPEGMDAETVKLFPDSFVDSELGKIPKGWKVDTIKEMTSSIQYGLTRSSTDYNPNRPHFLRITDIQGGRVDWSSVPFCDVSQDEFEKYKIVDNDVFVARTGASTGENIYICDSPRAVFASYLVRFQFSMPYVARYIAEFMRSPAYFDYVKGTIGGSAQPNASAQALAGAKVLAPQSQCMSLFYDVVHQWDVLKANNQKASHTLSNLRNTLLPKLLSGELRIKDAERFLEDVA
ncbi:MAG: restriction endonuclease subunit S [Kiritimatiellae bacterium]|nr:restriction endonuclease subunit S [Kiritimatiellia bacterium]MDD5519492.1 restriction endonuclease subunit S [Kiritimatiellia bacterium]